MYAKIVEALILSKIIEIFFMLFASVGTFFLIRAIEKHFEKKEKSVPKKGKKKNQQPQKGDSLPVVAFLLSVIFLIGVGMNLYTIFSLREDMINENYATYTGEFYYHNVYIRRGRRDRFITWENENGKSQNVDHDHCINSYQENYIPLEEGRYRGAIVYSPSSGYLLWWDAERIGE